MSVIQGILLGILQGIAEFLPISSSGHLAVAQNIFGLDDIPLLFDCNFGCCMPLLLAKNLGTFEMFRQMDFQKS